MFGWLLRLVGPAAPVVAPPPPVVDKTPEPAVDVSAGFGQRRPLVDRSGHVAGFELRLPAATERRLAVRVDEVSAAAQYTALLAAAHGVTAAGRQALVSVPAPLLARPAVAAQAGAGLWLLPVGGHPDAAVTQGLRASGARIGVADGPPDRAPAADFALLQASAGGLDTLLLSAQRWQQARPRLPLVALGLESIDDVERALAGGIALAGGRFAPAGGARPAKPLQAAAHRICELLNHLALDRDTVVVADAVRADVVLCYRLLRWANSPAIGLTRGVESVEQAVALLGRKELTRWLSVMLLSAAGGRQASAALQEHALARGRLLESLVRKNRTAPPEALFTVGLLSQLDLMLQMPLAAALAPLRLSEAASQALLEGRGPWADLLALALALEGDDEVLLAALAAPYGGTDAVLAEAERAWAWAAGLVESRGPPA